MSETQPWTPYPGDAVTWEGHDGSWIVDGGEDDDHVWVYRPGTRMVPVYARPGMVAMRETAPEHEELAPVCQLRPLNLPDASRDESWTPGVGGGQR